MHSSLPKGFPLFILASSVCWSLQCLISVLPQGGRSWSLFLGSLVQSCCGEGGTLQTNITGMYGACSRCFSHTGFAPVHGMCAFSVYTSGSRLLCWELSDVGLGLHAFPRSKPLTFRFSDTLKRHRLGWACILCLSQVREAQVTRCLVSAVAHS